MDIVSYLLGKKSAKGLPSGINSFNSGTVSVPYETPNLMFEHGIKGNHNIVVFRITSDPKATLVCAKIFNESTSSYSYYTIAVDGVSTNEKIHALGNMDLFDSLDYDHNFIGNYIWFAWN